MSESTKTSTRESHVARRVIARGALWAAPTAAFAVSAPAFAVSPVCEDCSTPLVGGGASTALVSVNKGTLNIAGSFTASLTGCTGLVSGGIVTTHQATLTMSDGRTYTTTQNLGLGAHVAGVATVGSGIAFTGVTFPNGLYASAAGVGQLPVRPLSVCFNLDIPLRIGGNVQQCSQTVCFAPSFVNANLGTVIGGSGSITYGTVWGE